VSYLERQLLLLVHKMLMLVKGRFIVSSGNLLDMKWDHIVYSVLNWDHIASN
jgi:hypothetical protein